jgi:hypothetical protein
VEFSLNGSGELAFREEDHCETEYSSETRYMGDKRKWDSSIPGHRTNYPPPESIGIDVDVIVDKVQFLDDLKIVLVSISLSSGKHYSNRYYALTPDKTKLVPLSESQLTLANQGKLEELVKKHLVEVPDSYNPKDFRTTFSYAVKKSP